MNYRIKLLFPLGRSVNMTSQGGIAERSHAREHCQIRVCSKRAVHVVKSCVAANCSNKYGHGVSLFKFPKGTSEVDQEC